MTRAVLLVMLCLLASACMPSAQFRRGPGSPRREGMTSPHDIRPDFEYDDQRQQQQDNPLSPLLQ